MVAQRRGQRPRRTASWSIIKFLLLFCFFLCSLYLWNQSYVIQSLEAPLDHLTSTLWKPYYQHVLGCPDMEQRQQQAILQSTTSIPFYMLSARPKHLVDPVLATYQQHFNVSLYNTTQLSRDYINHCQSPTFKSRLFGVYQIFLRDILATADSDYIVTVEDDVKLLDGEQFLRELSIAIANGYEYYSFTKNAKSCIYQFGTTAQLWSRTFIERSILQAPNGIVCRLPIDMYIAQQGPWYVTQHQLVQHVGTKRLTRISG